MGDKVAKLSKHYYLTQENIETILMVKEKYGYKKESEAMNHIIRHYQDVSSDRDRAAVIAEEILNLFSAQYKDYWKNLYFSTRYADKNIVTILDILNTMMIREKYEECIPIDIYKSSVIEGSQKHLQKKIAEKKQRKDRGKRRKIQGSR